MCTAPHFQFQFYEGHPDGERLESCYIAVDSITYCFSHMKRASNADITTSLIAGAVAGRKELVTAIRSMHNVLGGTVDPHAAFLLLRGMKTLGIRVNQQNKTALEIARRLELHPGIARVGFIGPTSLDMQHCAAYAT